MTYRNEFPDFDPATLPAIPADWKDSSWHNDACPCFNTGRGVFVFVDFADPVLREFPEGPRYSVMADPETHNHNESLMDSDDWQAVLEFVARQSA